MNGWIIMPYWDISSSNSSLVLIVCVDLVYTYYLHRFFFLSVLLLLKQLYSSYLRFSLYETLSQASGVKTNVILYSNTFFFFFFTGLGAARQHLLQGRLLQKQLLDDSAAKK